MFTLLSNGTAYLITVEGLKGLVKPSFTCVYLVPLFVERNTPIKESRRYFPTTL
jgi:hypothetical protein